MSKDKIADELEAINKQYGEGVAQILDGDSDIEVERWITDSAGWNVVLGGGIPKGRVIEIAGEASSGKTSSCYFLAGTVQKQGGRVVWIDAECCFETAYAQQAGINLKDLVLINPGNGEEAMDVAIRMAKAGVDLIIIDSVAALVPKAELEGEVTDMQMALQARLLGKSLRMLTPTIHKTGTTVVFINQMRALMGAMPFGPKSESAGGKALKFFCSVRVETKRIQTLKDKNSVAEGIKIRLDNKKCKVGKPLRSAEIEYSYDTGFDLSGELRDVGEALGVVTKKGNAYSYGEIVLGATREKAKKALDDDKALAATLRDEIAKK